jgi:hypothetical protein
MALHMLQDTLDTAGAIHMNRQEIFLNKTSFAFREVGHGDPVESSANNPTKRFPAPPEIVWHVVQRHSARIRA